MTKILIAAFVSLFLVSGCQSSDENNTKKIDPTPKKSSVTLVVSPTSTSREIKKSFQTKKPDLPTIESLKGKPKDFLIQLMGKPSFTRIDKPAQLWQYRHQNCLIDLYFYPEANGDLKLHFLNVRTIGSPKVESQVCLNKTIKSKKLAINSRLTN